MALNLKRTLRYHYLRVLRQRTSSHGLAMGLAVGVFAAFLPYLPVVPLHTLAAVGLAWALRGSAFVALTTVFVAGPVVPFLFWWLMLRLGQVAMPLPDVEWAGLDVQGLLDIGWRGLAVLTLGGVILGVPAGVATYLGARPAIAGYRRRRTIRLLRQRTSLGG